MTNRLIGTETELHTLPMRRLVLSTGIEVTVERL